MTGSEARFATRHAIRAELVPDGRAFGRWARCGFLGGLVVVADVAMPATEVAADRQWPECLFAAAPTVGALETIRHTLPVPPHATQGMLSSCPLRLIF